MNKDKILSILRSKIFIGGICLTLGVGIIALGCNISKLKTKINELKSAVNTLNATVEKKENEVKELQVKVDEAAPWFAMKEEERKVEEEKIAKELEAKKAEEERAKKEEEAKKEHKIGERRVFTYGSKGEFAFTINSVNLTSERNQFADPVKNVVEINYTVENISMDELDFFLDNQAEFYDANGTKCTTYPNSTGAGTYDIGKGRNATGKEFIGIKSSDEAYLEMELGGTIYKWSL